jgi:putative phosphoesterase
MPSATGYRVGLIADTHGLLRPEAMEALRGSDLVIHAGDIGDPAILKRLSQIAPVTAVRGNNDKAGWASHLPHTDLIRVGTAFIYVIHDLAELDLDPAAAGCSVVVSGHSHRPKQEWRDGVLFVNPGSAGPRRFSLPVALGYLLVSAERVDAGLIELQA